MISRLEDYYFVNGDISSIIIDNNLIINRSGDSKKLMYGQDITFLMEAHQEYSYFRTMEEDHEISEYYIRPSMHDNFTQTFFNRFDFTTNGVYSSLEDMYDCEPYRIKNTGLFEGDIKYAEIPYFYNPPSSPIWAVREYYDKLHKVLFEISNMTSVESDYRRNQPLRLSAVENLYLDYRNLGKYLMNDMNVSVVYSEGYSGLTLLTRNWGVSYEQRYDRREERYNKTIIDDGSNNKSFCVPVDKYMLMLAAKGWNNDLSVSRQYLCFVPISEMPISESKLQIIGSQIESLLEGITSPTVGTGGYRIELVHSKSGVARLYYSSRNTRWWD